MRNLIVWLVCLALAPSLALSADAKPKPAAVAAPTSAKPSPKTGSVSGRVIGPDGKPVAGATVRLLAPPSTKDAMRPRGRRADPPAATVAVSGADGAFKIEGVEGDAFLVRVEAKGFAPAFADKVPAGASLSLKLKTGLPIVGRALDLTTQKPVAGA